MLTVVAITQFYFHVKKYPTKCAKSSKFASMSFIPDLKFIQKGNHSLRKLLVTFSLLPRILFLLTDIHMRYIFMVSAWWLVQHSSKNEQQYWINKLTNQFLSTIQRHACWVICRLSLSVVAVFLLCERPTICPVSP